MKNLSLATFFFFFVFGNPSSVYSQTDSCSSYLNLQNTIPFNTTSFRCTSVWASEGFILRYLQSGSNLWSFVLSAPNTNAYIAIGFSTNGLMVGTSAIVGWVEANGSGIVKQYYLGGTNVNQVLPDEGNLQVVLNSTTIVSQSSTLYLAFQLNTNQPQSQLIYAVGPQGIIPSSNYYLSKHRADFSTSMNYASGQSSTFQNNTGLLTEAHGVLNMLGWGILMIIGIIVARYFRHHDPIWFYTHTTIQLIGFASGLSGIITGFVLEGSVSTDVSTHKAIGICILILGCFQVTAFLARPEKTAKVRKYWNWFHHYSGRVVIILSIANIFYGIYLGSGGIEWNAGYGAALGILLLSAIVLEIRMCMTKPNLLG